MKGCLFINDASPAPLLYLAPRQLEIFLLGHYRNLSLETNWAWPSNADMWRCHNETNEFLWERSLVNKPCLWNSNHLLRSHLKYEWRDSHHQIFEENFNIKLIRWIKQIQKGNLEETETTWRVEENLKNNPMISIVIK